MWVKHSSVQVVAHDWQLSFLPTCQQLKQQQSFQISTKHSVQAWELWLHHLNRNSSEIYGISKLFPDSNAELLWTKDSCCSCAETFFFVCFFVVPGNCTCPLSHLVCKAKSIHLLRKSGDCMWFHTIGKKAPFHLHVQPPPIHSARFHAGGPHTASEAEQLVVRRVRQCQPTL